jgi:hypothetical protein
VSEGLGHSFITLTPDPYSHVLRAMHKGAAGAMGRILAAKRTKTARRRDWL